MEFISTYFTLCSVILVVPFIIPFGIIVFKKYLDRKDSSTFKSKISFWKVSCPKKERTYMRGDKEDVTCHDFASVILMATSFCLISGIHQLFLKSWTPAFLCFTIAFLSAGVYFVIRDHLTKIDFYVYSESLKPEGSRNFIKCFAYFIWIVTSALFYTIITI